MSNDTEEQEYSDDCDNEGNDNDNSHDQTNNESENSDNDDNDKSVPNNEESDSDYSGDNSDKIHKNFLGNGEETSIYNTCQFTSDSEIHQCKGLEYWKKLLTPNLFTKIPNKNSEIYHHFEKANQASLPFILTIQLILPYVPNSTFLTLRNLCLSSHHQCPKFMVQLVDVKRMIVKDTEPPKLSKKQISLMARNLREGKSALNLNKTPKSTLTDDPWLILLVKDVSGYAQTKAECRKLIKKKLAELKSLFKHLSHIYKQISFYYHLFWNNHKNPTPSKSQLFEMIHVTSKTIGIENNSDWLKFIEVNGFTSRRQYEREKIIINVGDGVLSGHFRPISFTQSMARHYGISDGYQTSKQRQDQTNQNNSNSIHTEIKQEPEQEVPLLSPQNQMLQLLKQQKSSKHHKKYAMEEKILNHSVTQTYLNTLSSTTPAVTTSWAQGKPIGWNIVPNDHVLSLDQKVLDAAKVKHEKMKQANNNQSDQDEEGDDDRDANLSWKGTSKQEASFQRMVTRANFQESHRMEQLEFVRNERDYEDYVWNKKRCPICRNPQSYEETVIKRKGKNCKNCGVAYKHLEGAGGLSREGSHFWSSHRSQLSNALSAKCSLQKLLLPFIVSCIRLNCKLEQNRQKFAHKYQNLTSFTSDSMNPTSTHQARVSTMQKKGVYSGIFPVSYPVEDVHHANRWNLQEHTQYSNYDTKQRIHSRHAAKTTAIDSVFNGDISSFLKTTEASVNQNFGSELGDQFAPASFTAPYQLHHQQHGQNNGYKKTGNMTLQDRQLKFTTKRLEAWADEKALMTAQKQRSSIHPEHVAATQRIKQRDSITRSSGWRARKWTTAVVASNVCSIMFMQLMRGRQDRKRASLINLGSFPFPRDDLILLHKSFSKRLKELSQSAFELKLLMVGQEVSGYGEVLQYVIRGSRSKQAPSKALLDYLNMTKKNKDQSTKQQTTSKHSSSSSSSTTTRCLLATEGGGDEDIVRKKMRRRKWVGTVVKVHTDGTYDVEAVYPIHPNQTRKLELIGREGELATSRHQDKLSSMKISHHSPITEKSYPTFTLNRVPKNMFNLQSSSSQTTSPPETQTEFSSKYLSSKQYMRIKNITSSTSTLFNSTKLPSLYLNHHEISDEKIRTMSTYLSECQQNYRDKQVLESREDSSLMSSLATGIVNSLNEQRILVANEKRKVEDYLEDINSGLQAPLGLFIKP